MSTSNANFDEYDQLISETNDLANQAEALRNKSDDDNGSSEPADNSDEDPGTSLVPADLETIVSGLGGEKMLIGAGVVSLFIGSYYLYQVNKGN